MKIINDDGVIVRYDSKLFNTLEEWRELRINQLFE